MQPGPLVSCFMRFWRTLAAIASPLFRPKTLAVNQATASNPCFWTM